MGEISSISAIVGLAGSGMITARGMPPNPMRFDRRIRSKLAAAFLPIALLCPAGARPLPPVDPAIPPYAPSQTISGKIVIWGDDAFAQQLPSWSNGFKKWHPGAEFSWFMKGSSTSIGALYTGVAQIGFLGREIRPLEIVSWSRIFPYKPLVLPVATGGFDTYNGTNSVVILVNKDNPLEHISLEQIDAVYSHDRKRGATEPITTWGQLGLVGEWERKPIAVYGLFEATGTAQFMQARVLKEGRWDYNVRLPSGAPSEMYKGSGNDTALALEGLIRADRYAMGIGTIRSVKPGLKALKVGEPDAGPIVEDRNETTLDRTYPLCRQVYIVVNKDPKKAWDPKVHEFLSYIFSREGQEAVARAGLYYPLPAKYLEAQRARLISN